MKYIFSLILISSALLAQNSRVYSESGLEVDDLNYIDILVEYLTEDAKSLDLNRDDLDGLVRMALRSNGIKPIISDDGSLKPYLLYININVLGNAFHIELAFKRTVLFNLIDGTYATHGIAYRIGITGTHGNKKVFITDGLRDLIDEFCIDYYKANKNK